MTRSSILVGTLTCPFCGRSNREAMPEDACLYFYDCPSCGGRLMPRRGDCCVFCSYGDVPCPPVQASRGCGDAVRPGSR